MTSEMFNMLGAFAVGFVLSYVISLAIFVYLVESVKERKMKNE